MNLITSHFAIYFFQGWGTAARIVKCLYHKNCWDRCLRRRWTPRMPTPVALMGCWGRLVPTPRIRARTRWSCWSWSCWAPSPGAVGGSSGCPRWSRACPCWAWSPGISRDMLFSWAGDRGAVSTARFHTVRVPNSATFPNTAAIPKQTLLPSPRYRIPKALGGIFLSISQRAAQLMWAAALFAQQEFAGSCGCSGRKSFFFPTRMRNEEPRFCCQPGQNTGKNKSQPWEIEIYSKCPSEVQKSPRATPHKQQNHWGSLVLPHIQDQGHSWKQCPPVYPGQNSYIQVPVRTTPAWLGLGVIQHRSKLSLAKWITSPSFSGVQHITAPTTGFSWNSSKILSLEIMSCKEFSQPSWLDSYF